jgi:catechol 2,3-dioxygenase-like lactoylglutathione lyase family enzyme
MREQPRLVLLILAVSELARSARFYEEALGAPRAVEVPVYIELALPSGMRLGLYQREAFGRNTGQVPRGVAPGEIAGTELYLQVEDIEEAGARLLAAGARLLSPRAPRPWGDEAAYFADPDGNVVVAARPYQPEAGEGG